MIKFGDKRRPVGRFIPQPILARFDRIADWLDVPIFTMPNGFKFERWIPLIVITTLPLCALWALWVGWKLAFTAGPLLTLMVVIWLW
jgi:hypothetical protein